VDGGYTLTGCIAPEKTETWLHLSGQTQRISVLANDLSQV
jgi:hypothetical protein